MHALKLTPHVFQRPGELRQMEWTEIDFAKAVWTLPAANMKMRQPHAVPLSRQALAILEGMRGLSGNGKYVFRSEEHTSELQSLMRISYAVFCLTKKKHNNQKCDT